jgi:hypothetical protein
MLHRPQEINDRAVRNHHALRLTSRAGGVDDIGQILSLRLIEHCTEILASILLPLPLHQDHPQPLLFKRQALN